MTQIRKYRHDDEATAEGYWRLSVRAGEQAWAATRALARAAACEEACDDDAHSEYQLYFIVRAMCAEHGFNYDDIVASARNYAAGVGEGSA